MEQRIVDAEQLLQEKRAALQDPAITRDGRLLQEAFQAMEAAQRAVDELYSRWSELEEKIR